MSNIVAVLIVRCRHTGVYADGRPNTASVTIYDLDEITIQKNRTRAVPVPFGSGTTRPPVDIPMSTRTFVSWHEGALCKLTNLGLITTEIILQLRDKGNCGGPAGTGQALQPAVLNVERTGDSLRLVIPDNVLPTNLDSIGFMVGEPVTITGFKEPGVPPVYRGFDGEYEISVATPGSGLGGVAAGSYLIEVPLPAGAPQPLVTLSTINICLTEGRVVSQFNSTGDVGGFGPNVFGYVGGMFLPHAASGGGAGTIAVYDGGVLIDAAATTIDFIGAGVTASSAGVGLVDVTIPGGGGGGETLAQTLVLGNTTGGTNISVSTGDSIIGVTDLVLDPGAAGTDNVIIDGLTWPGADGSAGEALITNGAGVLSFAAVVFETRTLTAGAGLTGGGDLSADRTFDVGANADGSVIVNANDIQVGVLATDAQHGARGGGTQHALVVSTAAGFQPQSNRSAAVNPAVTDDSAGGYAVGSYWVNTTTNEAFVCLDDSVGAAIWSSTTAGGGGTTDTAVLYWGNSSVANSTASRILDPGYGNRTAPLTSGTSIQRMRIARAGTLRNLFVLHNNPGGSGAAITYTVRVNGTPTIITVGVASTSASGADTTNSVVVAAGDIVDIEVTKAAVAGAGSRRPEVSIEVAA